MPARWRQRRVPVQGRAHKATGASGARDGAGAEEGRIFTLKGPGLPGLGRKAAEEGLLVGPVAAQLRLDVLQVLIVEFVQTLLHEFLAEAHRRLSSPILVLFMCALASFSILFGNFKRASLTAGITIYSCRLMF